MKIATFNVNSVNARLENLLPWLKKTEPDVLLLQEIKTEYNAFPFMEFSALGYNAQVLGQKSYNGVAVLSRHKLTLRQENLPNFPDAEARYLEAEFDFCNQKYIVASVYLPNGNPPYDNPLDNSKLEYKLKWMEALYKHAENLLDLHQNVILGGDFNVILENADVYDPVAFAGNALFKEPVRQRMKALLYLGFYDAFRALHPNVEGYTFWDYTGQSLAAGFGMRIDYLLLSPLAADKLVYCEVDKKPRQGVKPSDHTPLVVGLRE